MAHLAFVLGRQQMAKGAQLLQLALDAGRAFQQQSGHGIDVGRALIFHAFGQQAQTVGQGGKIAFDVQQGGAGVTGKSWDMGNSWRFFSLEPRRTQKGSGCRKLTPVSGPIPPKGLVLAHTRSPEYAPQTRPCGKIPGAKKPR